MPKKIKSIKDLSFDEKNINRGSEFGTSLLHKSLQEVGAGRSVLADKNGVLIAGNKTIEAAGQLGITKIKVVETTGDEVVVVQRTDLDINSKQGAAMKILDNTVSKHNYIEDATVAEAICEEYKLEPIAYGLDEKKAEVTEDDFDGKPPVNPITKLGDLYELNEHRVLCGDSCDAAVVEKTLNGCKPILMVTDPPYGVNYDPEWRNIAEGKGFGAKLRSTGKVLNDDRCDWQPAYALFPGKIVYVWHGDRHARTVQQNLEDCGFVIVCQIIWAKPSITFGRGDYHWQHEPCWYAVKKGSNHNYVGDRKQTTLWEIAGTNPAGRSSDKNNEAMGHGTQKPIECMARPIRNNTNEGQQVYDPFLGSGTTIIAADQLNRGCYGQELDPGYCDMTVARYAKFRQQTGGSLVIKKNGRQLSDKEIQKYLDNVL